MRQSLLLAFFLTTATWMAAQSEPDNFQKFPTPPATTQAPRLVVPIGHTSDIIAGAISPDEQYFLTGGSDHSAILWNRSGKELQTFKDGNDDILAVAFLFTARDKYVVTGDAQGSIVLWDLSGNKISSFTMSLSRREDGAWIKKIAFSPDGKTVFIGDRYGETYVDVMTGEKTKAFNLPAPIPAPAFIPSEERVVFSSTGKLVLSFLGNSVTCWHVEGKKILSFGRGDALLSPVVSIAFSPADSEKRIRTVGGSGVSRFWDLAKGYPGQSLNSHLLSPDWTTMLFYDQKANKSILKSLAGNTIQTFEGLGLAFSPDGKTVLTSVKGGAKLWDLTSGKELAFFKPIVEQPANDDNPFNQLASLRENPFDAAVFSPVTKEDPAGGKYILTLRNFRIAELWSRDNPKLALKEWKVGENYSPKLLGGSELAFSPDGKSVLLPFSEAIVEQISIDSGETLQQYQGHHAPLNAVTSIRTAIGGTFILTGSDDYTAKLWDPANNVVKRVNEMAQELGAPISEQLIGGEIQTYAGHKNAVISVAFSPVSSDDSAGGKYVLTGSSDNTAKIWERDSGKEICTLISFGANEWVVTAPSGLFDASPGAMNLMYFVIGSEAVELEQLKERYYEPNLLAKLMGLSKDPSRSVEAFNAVALYPEMTAQLSTDKLKIQVDLKARNGGIGKLSFFVNGKEVLEDANPNRATTVSLNLMDYAQYFLPNTTNKLTLRVYNQAGWLKSSALELDYVPLATARGTNTGSNNEPVLVGKPSLYAVVVGTSNYTGTNLDLTFADKDATSFSQALRAASSRIFGDKVSVTLLNTDATDKNRQDVSSKTTIKKAFTDIAAKAKAQDILVIYFSGHGVNYGTAENGQFYYLTKDIASENLSDPEIRNNYTVSSAELTDWIKAIPALKQVLIFDACNSGKLIQDIATASKDLSSSQIRALDRMKDRTGMFILTGSAADKVSYEAGQYGQGLLTYSLLQGMSGLALTEDKRVDVMTLFQYTRDKVPELAKGIGGIQKPILAFPANGASFDIGIVDAQVKIPLAQVKPVFIRNNLTEEAEYNDVLGLTDALENYFRALTVKGAQADLIFVDVKEYENAYSIQGRYKVIGDKVVVHGRLFKGKTKVGNEFEISGQKNDLPGLANAIYEKVLELLPH